MNANAFPHRYVFVGGLHRSGTSLTARLIAALPGMAAIRDAPVPENEGVYLQGGIAHTAQHGRPMHFATDPAQHLIEGCALDRLETRQRIETDWAPWFDQGHWRVEKSPVNLTRMRLLQQLFPLSQFVVVIRHPQAVAAAVSKWVDMPEAAMIDHWIAAHRQVAQDLEHLHSAMVLRYEDLVARPDAHRRALAAFVDLPTGDTAEDVRDGNGDYAYGQMTPAQAAAMAEWGYGARGAVMPLPPQVRHPLRAIREATEAALRYGAACR
ncbi:sulfotransferase [Paracoccus sp. 1_MG-2023]|uniref:sulfotransferase family protein n=1 Tax=unclassified Paracoccus (in: a-proteobacteria) TaxID=2688777 RepID=UPI001C089A6D|nr:MULTISPECIES: sulfotransferase [unclassified Paracoccus (in: a-proteobacteria)]MBU2956048.1 sulfotransferase [Paracoccus sp. C2R09]MDO6669454.1 sulfotransferase [Paracoccus sp. 1_MG-2023]